MLRLMTDNAATSEAQRDSAEAEEAAEATATTILSTEQPHPPLLRAAVAARG
jgi:hypothetical protein